MMMTADYNMAASRLLDAHHLAVDENPDDPTGTCALCPFADGWRADGWGHYTLFDESVVSAWLAEPTSGLPRQTNRRTWDNPHPGYAALRRLDGAQ